LSSFQEPGFDFSCLAHWHLMFPPEPPVAIVIWPERRTAVKGAPLFGAAKGTLDGEHRSGIDTASTGGGAGT
jgi:hypothetical protein